MAATAASRGLDATIEALADPVRRRAVELLSTRPHRSGELAGRVGVDPATMSKHLRVLRRSGVVSERADELDARVRIYSLHPAPMGDLRAWLAQTEAGWVEQLTALRDHLADDA